MTTLLNVGKGVISERNELFGTKWADCTQAAALRCCADAGVIFPLTDLDKEREALERADDYPDEGGATMEAIIVAMDRRYGYSGSKITNLSTALRTPGQTLLVQGYYGNLAKYLQQWQANTDFNHSLAYRVLTPTSGTLLDPLAPMGYKGDTVSPEVIEAFAWGASTSRVMKWNEVMSDGSYVIYNLPGHGDIAGGVPFFNDYGLTISRGKMGSAGARVKVYGYRGSAYAIGVKTAQGWPDGIARLTNVFVKQTNISNLVAGSPPPPPDCTANVKEAIVLRDAAWHEWMKGLPPL